MSCLPKDHHLHPKIFAEHWKIIKKVALRYLSRLR